MPLGGMWCLFLVLAVRRLAAAFCRSWSAGKHDALNMFPSLSLIMKHISVSGSVRKRNLSVDIKLPYIEYCRHVWLKDCFTLNTCVHIWKINNLLWKTGRLVWVWKCLTVKSITWNGWQEAIYAQETNMNKAGMMIPWTASGRACMGVTWRRSCDFFFYTCI